MTPNSLPIVPTAPPCTNPTNCPMLSMPYDVVSHIFDIVTCDASWDVYLPPHFGYIGSPLAAAMNLSHVCTQWRTEILADEALWGRMLNTAYFPTFDNTLWKLVYHRAGDKPVWLRHFDRAPPQAAMRRLNAHEEYAFENMFLWAIENISPDRIRRLEMDVWHKDLLALALWKIGGKISKAVAHHVTHLRLGNSLYAAGLAHRARKLHDNPNLNLENDVVAGRGFSWQLIHLVFGHHLKHKAQSGEHSRLRQLSIHAMSISIDDLLNVLRTSVDLDTLDLWISSDHELYETKIPASDTSPLIHLPRLRNFRMGSTPGMGSNEYSRFNFSIAGESHMYHCFRDKGLYTIQRADAELAY